MIRKLRRTNHLTAGFSLLEVLIIVVILGILATIATPAWLSFMNRQRLNRSGEQLLQALRLAQGEAKRSGTYQEVRFNMATDPPRFAVVKVNTQYNPGVTLSLVPSSQINTWEAFGNDEIQAGITSLSENNPNSDSIIFGPRGEVARTTIAPTNSNLPFIVTLALRRSPNVKRCVRVESLLGAISMGENNACP